MRPLFALLGAAALALGCASPPDPHPWHAVPARRDDGLVHALIEIPAGTNAKWELDRDTGRLAWEQEDGRPRVVPYLPYPANYGMVPRTLLPAAEGGDGDALDVIVLGPARPRGEVAAAKLLGVLELLDGGERDDKLVAVLPGTPLADVDDLAGLDERHPGVTRILEVWFTSYKGPGKLESRGFAGRERAEEILRAAARAYEAAH